MVHRRPAALLGAAALVAASIAAFAAVGPAARASDTPRTALGKDGQKLTVSASADLAPDGETLRVTGSGYDATKAVYVALCKDNGDNRVPTPCLGGADQSGTGTSSQWIVPEGDEYAGDLAVTWGAGGTFDVEIAVRAEDASLDCAEVACSVVTRVDHRNPGDRSQDVRVPVTFVGQDPGDSDGGEGVDVPPGTVRYAKTAEFTTAGRPLDLLLHPDSGKLYVGSDNVPDTADVAEQGLYAIDPKDGEVLGHVQQAPGSNGALAARVVRWIAAPLAGDGVAFHYPLRGLGTARDGDTVARGVWLTGGTVTGVGPGTDASTVLVAQGATLSRVETATGAVEKTATLAGGGVLGVDTARGVAWSADPTGGKLYRVDTHSLAVTATVELPAASVYFVETDPLTGHVWVGSSYDVLVFDQDGKPLAELTGVDRATAMAFDRATGEAFVLREDWGTAEDGADGVGALEVYDSATAEQAAEPVALPGSRAGAYAGVAVAPGATSVYVTDQAESEVVRLDRRVSPKVVQSPTDQSVAAGDEVTLVAAAEGTPEPTARWQVSPDGGQTWSTVEDAARNTYSFTAKTAQDGYRYRAEFTNSVGTTRTSPITLTVTEPDDGDEGGTQTPSGEPSPVGTDPVDTDDDGTGGTGGDGGSGPGTGTADGGTGTAASTTGGSGASGTSAAGGSLASTGVTVLSVTALAAALLAAGWTAYRKGRSAN
ncbi:immunoglobulin I-set domain protein [Streptomyces sp. NPDC098781]|uniref:immunoglobulin I-set domain protein n=1 Tax=Streptomyces sp. NPDC098781 TaxID=3366097 RepID=UPI0038244D16